MERYEKRMSCREEHPCQSLMPFPGNVCFEMCKRIGSLLLLSVVTAAAHPGIGIVQDRRGNVFITDTKQVWKIAPEGRISVAVPGVHTHELCLDSNDDLYGEDLWYEGDATRRSTSGIRTITWVCGQTQKGACTSPLPQRDWCFAWTSTATLES
jgi:hypothetical protein